MRIVPRLFPASLIVVACLGLATPSAFADLIHVTDIEVTGTGLGAVNTLVTVHDTGNEKNGTESGCINLNGSFTPCLGGVEGGDNTAINNVLSFSNNTNFAAVVNIAEPGQDVTVTLTHLYLGFDDGVGGTYTAFYTGSPLILTSGTGTGLGKAGFVFALDDTQFAAVQALGPVVSVFGGVQFEKDSTSGAPETVYVLQTLNGQVVPEPSTVLFLGSGLVGLALLSWRRRRAS